jgi:uncharacterized protein (TIGR03066 family)
MRILGGALMLCVGLALTGCGGGNKAKTPSNTNPSAKDTAVGDPGPYAAKLVGVWEVVKSADAHPGSTVEYAKDGKMTTVSVKPKGEKKGTYKVEGNKIISFFNGQVETSTIETLNDSSLITKDEDNRIDEFKRKK